LELEYCLETRKHDRIQWNELFIFQQLNLFSSINVHKIALGILT